MVLRTAVPGDEMAVARVHVRAWQVAYRGLIPEGYLDRLRPEDRAVRYDFTHEDPLKPQTVVAVDDDAICGFVTVGPARDKELKNFGELMALYVEPDRWKQGYGLALVREGRERLMALGYSSAYLWLLRENRRAARFYGCDRWMPDGARRIENVWGVLLEEDRLRRKLK
jgi:GNAT superfamily N-acetyltransferase